MSGKTKPPATPIAQGLDALALGPEHAQHSTLDGQQGNDRGDVASGRILCASDLGALIAMAARESGLASEHTIVIIGGDEEIASAYRMYNAGAIDGLIALTDVNGEI